MSIDRENRRETSPIDRLSHLEDPRFARNREKVVSFLEQFGLSSKSRELVNLALFIDGIGWTGAPAEQIDVARKAPSIVSERIKDLLDEKEDARFNLRTELNTFGVFFGVIEEHNDLDLREKSDGTPGNLDQDAEFLVCDVVRGIKKALSYLK